MKKILLGLIVLAALAYADINITKVTSNGISCKSLNIEPTTEKPSIDGLRKAIDIYSSTQDYFECRYPDIKISSVLIGEVEHVDDPHKLLTLSYRVVARWGIYEIQKALVTPPKGASISIQTLQNGQKLIYTSRVLDLSFETMYKTIEPHFSEIFKIVNFTKDIYKDNIPEAAKLRENIYYSYLALSFSSNDSLFKINDTGGIDNLLRKEGWSLSEPICMPGNNSYTYIKKEHNYLLESDKGLKCFTGWILYADSLINNISKKKINFSDSVMAKIADQ